jgi:hypothetical protein
MFCHSSHLCWQSALFGAINTHFMSRISLVRSSLKTASSCMTVFPDPVGAAITMLTCDLRYRILLYLIVVCLVNQNVWLTSDCRTCVRTMDCIALNLAYLNSDVNCTGITSDILTSDSSGLRKELFIFPNYIQLSRQKFLCKARNSWSCT